MPGGSQALDQSYVTRPGGYRNTTPESGAQKIFLNAAGVSLGNATEQSLCSGLDGSKGRCAAKKAQCSMKAASAQ
jgi:hypothetical protein